MSMVLHENSAILDTLGKIGKYSQKRAKRDIFPFSDLFEKRDVTFQRKLTKYHHSFLV